MYSLLATVCRECDVLGDNVGMQWIVEEVAGAACGVDCSYNAMPICVCRCVTMQLMSVGVVTTSDMDD